MLGDVWQPRDVYCRYTSRTARRQQRAQARRVTGFLLVRSWLLHDIQRYMIGTGSNT